ncbi:MAG: hypothetical protein AAF555_05770 [Verrucomicrobiota bacterium]
MDRGASLRNQRTAKNKELQKTCHQLDEKSAPVMRVIPSGDEVCGKDDCELVTIADEIRSATRNVQIVIRNHRSMLDRAEV